MIKANRSGGIGAGNLDEYWRRAQALKGSVLIPPRSAVKFGQVSASLDKRHEKSVGARAHEMARALLAGAGRQAADPSAVMTVSHIPEDAD